MQGVVNLGGQGVRLLPGEPGGGGGRAKPLGWREVFAYQEQCSTHYFGQRSVKRALRVKGLLPAS